MYGIRWNAKQRIGANDTVLDPTVKLGSRRPEEPVPSLRSRLRKPPLEKAETPEEARASVDLGDRRRGASASLAIAGVGYALARSDSKTPCRADLRDARGVADHPSTTTIAREHDDHDPRR